MEHNMKIYEIGTGYTPIPAAISAATRRIRVTVLAPCFFFVWAFSMIVLPCASAAAIMILIVAPTDTISIKI